MNPLWGRLHAQGLVEGGAPPSAATLTVPWYVRIMTGVAGWIAALLLIAVVPLGFRVAFEQGSSWLLLGTLSCVVAWLLSRRQGSNDFTEQFVFALSVSGQFQVLFGLEQLIGWNARGLALALAGLEILLFFAIAGFVHRVWTVAAGSLALLYAIGGLQHSNSLLALVLGAFALVWLNEFSLPRHRSHLQPLGYGLLSVVGILVITGSIDMGGLRSGFVPEQGVSGGLLLQPLLGAMAVAAVVIVATLGVLKQQVIDHRQGVGLALLCVAVLVALTALWAPGVGAAYLVILIGHAHTNRVLLGLGSFGLLAYLGHYYYALELSLLHKSALLTTAGLALILARLLYNKVGLFVPEDKPTGSGGSNE